MNFRVVVTYLRFQAAQRKFCLKHWPSPGFSADEPAVKPTQPVWQRANTTPPKTASAQELRKALKSLKAELQAFQAAIRTNREAVIRTQSQQVWVQMKPLWTEVRDSINKDLREVRARLPESQSELLTLDIHPDLLQAAGSRRKARLWVARGEKVASTFDRATWMATRTLKDPVTGTVITISTPHNGKSRASLAT